MKIEAIPDTGLRLAILDALIRAGQLDTAVIAERMAGIAEAHEEESDRIAAALERIASVEIDPSALATIQSIHFDGGNDIYMTIEEAIDVDTGGETEDYQLGSLAGIERLEALTSLNLDAHGYRDADLDLSPLRGHPSLETLRLSGRCTHAATLETLSKLKKLDAVPSKLDDPAVVDRLRARGVDVGRN